MRLGTRGSALALAQARLVADLLGGAELVTTAELAHGARSADADEGRGGDKSRWVRGLEQALFDGEIDLAVHSAKDVPEELPEGLTLVGAPVRAAAEDVLCGAPALDSLPAGSRVGTSSPRRAAQLRAAREDIDVVPLAGNVDSRLRKLHGRADRLDAIAIARAGLARLGREQEIGAVLDPARFVPAPGQGVIALEGREDDERARKAASAITDEPALQCLLAERALSRALGSSCHTPIGAHALPAGSGRDGETLSMRAWVGLPDGSTWISDRLAGPAAEPQQLGEALARRMRAAGAEDVLRAAEEMALDAG
jgi:hydroxymethylbilane synthase